MSQPLEVIIELQQALNELQEAEGKLQGVPDWMTELDEEYRTTQGKIRELETAVQEASASRRSAEGQASDAQERLKRYQQQINAVTNQREYGALLQEIDTTKGQISALEAQALTSLDTAEKADAELATARQQFEELEARYQEQLARWEAQKPEIAATAEQLRTKVAAYRASLPRPFLAQFERVHERTRGRAISPIRRVERGGKLATMWHCGVCNFNVRPQVVVEIRNTGALMQCDSCKRILYVEAPELATVGA